MALPNGAYDARVLSILKNCGILYVRPVIHRPDFNLPADFMEWAATCHHSDNLTGLWESFARVTSRTSCSISGAQLRIRER